MPEYTLYDTPGITRHDSLLTHAPDAVLREVIPFRPLRPQVYQLHEDQSYALGGMVRLDVRCAEKGTVVAYFSDRLKLHRGKLEKADALWQKHLGGLLSPTLDSDRSRWSPTAARCAKRRSTWSSTALAGSASALGSARSAYE